MPAQTRSLSIKLEPTASNQSAAGAAAPAEGSDELRVAVDKEVKTILSKAYEEMRIVFEAGEEFEGSNVQAALKK